MTGNVIYDRLRALADQGMHVTVCPARDRDGEPLLTGGAFRLPAFRRLEICQAGSRERAAFACGAALAVHERAAEHGLTDV